MTFVEAYWWTQLMYGVPVFALMYIRGLGRSVEAVAAFAAPWSFFSTIISCWVCNPPGYKAGQWIPPVQLCVIAHDTYWSAYAWAAS